SSEEGTRSGLGWIDGEVKKFSTSAGNGNIRIPHMGWNNVRPTQETGVMKDMDGSSLFYFLHSYHFECPNPNNIIGMTDYHGQFPSAVASQNIFGVQFHPEKSHRWGVRLLENFAKL